jgi:hypothetical protein
MVVKSAGCKRFLFNLIVFKKEVMVTSPLLFMNFFEKVMRKHLLIEIYGGILENVADETAHESTN